MKESIIFDNYDIEEQYPDNELIEQAIECNWVECRDDITKTMIDQWRFEESNFQWDIEREQLFDFFANNDVIFFGNVGLWHGNYDGGDIGDFETLFYKALKDCAYFRITDKNGHLYISGDHHDGHVSFEVRVLTDKGREYYDNWDYSYNDKRTEQYVHNQIIKRYSKLPHYSKIVYGV